MSDKATKATQEQPKAAVGVKKIRGLMSIKTRIRAGGMCKSCL